MMNSTLSLVGNESKFISDILYEWKRWVKIHNRREPITTEMIEFIVTKGKIYEDQNNIYSSIGDWFILGEKRRL